MEVRHLPIMLQLSIIQMEILCSVSKPGRPFRGWKIDTLSVSRTLVGTLLVRLPHQKGVYYERQEQPRSPVSGAGDQA